MHLALLPVVILAGAIFPTALTWIEELPIGSRWWRLRIPPRSRYYVHEIHSFAFTCILTFADVPITRGESRPELDWLIVMWALANLLTQ